MSRVIISGGGTGGHVFPAIAIAHALRRLEPGIELLFVGALGRLEMTEVPKAGYKIEGLPVMGFPRRLTFDLLKFPVRLSQSLIKARSVIKKFKPDVVVGVGGYSSGPSLRMASLAGIPTVIQEQNSYPGATNLILAKKAAAICVAYPGMERYFPKDKLVYTGNPVRKDLLTTNTSRQEAGAYFGLDPQRKTVLVMGGSGGAVTINNSMACMCRDQEVIKDIQVIWQTGKRYFETLRDVAVTGNIRIVPFIDRMDLAFSIADLVVSRAGAIAISELCLLGKAIILVPSPNVTGDHQRKNAQVLADQGAARVVEDQEALDQLPVMILNTLDDQAALEQLRMKSRELATPGADERIAEEVLKQIKRNR